MIRHSSIFLYSVLLTGLDVNEEQLLVEGQDFRLDVHITHACFICLQLFPKKSIWLNVPFAPRIVVLSNFCAFY